MNAYGKITLVAAALLMSPAAFAQTEADCEAAIEKAQSDAASDGVLQSSDAKMNELSTSLARAGTAGIEGDYAKCLEMVRDARGGAGLRVD